MEAWILHVKEMRKTNPKDSQISEENRYSSWATEQQALKAAGQFIKEQMTGVPYVLSKPAITLIDAGEIGLAIGLLNTYTSFGKDYEEYRQYLFRIVQSTFQSPLE